MPGSKKTIPAEDAADVKIAVMNNDIKHINDTLGRLEGKFDAAIQSFATNQQLVDAQNAAEVKHKEYEKMQEKMQTALDALINKDAEQQGAIDANRRLVNYGLTILGIVVAGVCTYLGLHR